MKEEKKCTQLGEWNIAPFCSCSSCHEKRLNLQDKVNKNLDRLK